MALRLLFAISLPLLFQASVWLSLCHCHQGKGHSSLSLFQREHEKKNCSQSSHLELLLCHSGKTPLKKILSCSSPSDSFPCSCLFSSSTPCSCASLPLLCQGFFKTEVPCFFPPSSSLFFSPPVLANFSFSLLSFSLPLPLNLRLVSSFSHSFPLRL